MFKRVNTFYKKSAKNSRISSGVKLVAGTAFASVAYGYEPHELRHTLPGNINYSISDFPSNHSPRLYKRFHPLFLVLSNAPSSVSHSNIHHSHTTLTLSIYRLYYSGGAKCTMGSSTGCFSMTSIVLQTQSLLLSGILNIKEQLSSYTYIFACQLFFRKIFTLPKFSNFF